ncbi:hypothetical protein [Metabacillus arenae]|nr:hypothetical protein [Metabacillus arenae]
MIIKIFGTDIGVVFHQLYEAIDDKAKILADEGVMLKGMYRK